MNRALKRYLMTWVLALAGIGLTWTAAYFVGPGSGRFDEDGWRPVLFGVLVVGSFIVAGAAVALEKGRSLLWGLAGFIAPLMPIILLLPHTNRRRAELLGEGRPGPAQAPTQSTAQPLATAAQPTQAPPAHSPPAPRRVACAKCGGPFNWPASFKSGPIPIPAHVVDKAIYCRACNAEFCIKCVRGACPRCGGDDYTYVEPGSTALHQSNPADAPASALAPAPAPAKAPAPAPAPAPVLAPAETPQSDPPSRDIAETTTSGSPQAREEPSADAIQHYDEGLRNLCKSQANKRSFWYGDARRAFTEAIEAAPDFARAYEKRAICFAALGEAEMASADRASAAELDRSRTSSPNRELAETLCRRARHGMETGGLIEESLLYLYKAIDADPTYADAFDARSDVYTTIGMPDEAIADIKQVGALNRVQRA